MTGNQRCHHLVRPNAQQHNHTQHYQGRRQVPPTRDSLAPDPSAQHFCVVPSPAVGSLCKSTYRRCSSVMFRWHCLASALMSREQSKNAI